MVLLIIILFITLVLLQQKKQQIGGADYYHKVVLNSVFHIDGVKRKTLKLKRGDTHYFIIPRKVYEYHPFYFSHMNVFGGASRDCPWNPGVTKMFENSHVVISLKVLPQTPSVLYYHSGIEAHHGGVINVVD